MQFFHSLLKIPYRATSIKIFALPLLSLLGPSWSVCDYRFCILLVLNRTFLGGGGGGGGEKNLLVLQH